MTEQDKNKPVVGITAWNVVRAFLFGCLVGAIAWQIISSVVIAKITGGGGAYSQTY